MTTFTLPGTLDSLQPIRDRVLAAAREAGLDNKAAYRLALAVDEIATNIVIHGYEEMGREGDIQLLIHTNDQHLQVVLEDDGAPFDPRAHDEPDTLDTELHERPVGGLGVYLALQGVDRFDYEYAGGKNRNIFVMNRPGG